MTVDLTALWHTNRRWRAWMNANTKFVTPTTLQSLRHMRNECCEAADLISRQEHPEEVRNNGRNSTIEQELADVAVMALTALDYKPVYHDWWDEGEETFDIDELCDSASETVTLYKHDASSSTWRLSVGNVLQAVLLYPGLDLASELDRCWRRLAYGHGMSEWGKYLGYNTYDSFWTHVSRVGVNNLPVPWFLEEQSS